MFSLGIKSVETAARKLLDVYKDGPPPSPSEGRGKKDKGKQRKDAPTSTGKGPLITLVFDEAHLLTDTGLEIEDEAVPGPWSPFSQLRRALRAPRNV